MTSAPQLQSFTTGGVTRLSGDSRYTTAARTAQVIWPQMSNVVHLATGRNPGVASVPHGFEAANVNLLTARRALDPLTSLGPGNSGIPVTLPAL